jgi:hypothetical protein
LSWLVDLGLPGLLFIGILAWLVRKVARAARTEGDLEEGRLQGALAEELRLAKERAALSQRPPLAAVPNPTETSTSTSTSTATATANSTANSIATAIATPIATPTATATPIATSSPTSIAAQPALKTPTPPSSGPLAGADLTSANTAHLPLIAEMVAERETQLRSQHAGAEHRRIEVLWVRSNDTHCAWCERRHPASTSARARDVICVALIERGKVIDRWSFG